MPHHIVREDQMSDDEIFFGKLSLDEVKKHILWSTGHSKTKIFDAANVEESGHSVNIIETHSEPYLRPVEDIKAFEFVSVPGSPAHDNFKWNDSLNNESFLKMEEMVSKLCLSPNRVQNVELNNTLEMVDYILKNGPDLNAIKTDTDIIEEKHTQNTLYTSPKKEIMDSPVLKDEKIDLISSPKYFTPTKIIIKQSPEKFVTPSGSPKFKTPIFKTPVNLPYKKPASSLKKTLAKPNAYQHIASPVAAYIRNCPQSPLVKDVHPSKPLPGPSAIPKFVKTSLPHKTQNKENINLPSVVYKSAKKTKVITIPDQDKLPQSQWAKKITSTLPRPTVMKHQNREISSVKKPLLEKQDDSFVNLSCLQAEVSICTQKTAFKKINKD